MKIHQRAILWAYIVMPLLLCVHFVLAQDTPLEIINAKTYKLSLGNHSYLSDQKLPFKEIRVYDYRFDTSKLYYDRNESLKTKYNKVALETNWDQMLNGYFKNNLDSSSSQTLVIAIRNYWIQDDITEEIKKRKTTARGSIDPIGTNYYRKTSGYCRADLDVYTNNGIGNNLKALFKIEDSFLELYDTKAEKFERLFFLPFDSIAARLQHINLSRIMGSRRDISMEEFVEHYRTRFKLPVLQTASITRGIFLTFEDFKKNKPIGDNFKVIRGSITDEVYLVNDRKEESIVSEFWGLFDGRQLFIRSGYNVFPAVASQNSFEIYGVKHITDRISQMPLGIVPLGGSTATIVGVKFGNPKLDKKILQLNMDTGEFF